MTTIIQATNPILRQTAEPVAPDEFGTTFLAELLHRMRQALDSEVDGIALAAPQIGASKRLFIISEKIKSSKQNMPTIFINPRIIRLSKRRRIMEEGCLSVRYWYGHVSRAERVTVTAQDERGTIFTHHGSGLIAQIFQHEIDHLDGRLFTDTATNLCEIPPTNTKTT